MHSCDCHTFVDLELTREAINRRARATKALKARLTLVARHPDGEHRLLCCPQCGQQWQRSLAWNWGNKEYLFRVPAIETDAWLAQPYVQPDDLLIFAASLGKFLAQQSSAPTGQLCHRSDCEEAAIKLSTFCLRHHIANLQSVGLFAPPPTGSWFEPYLEENFAIPRRIA